MKPKTTELYPEVVAAGGLPQAIDKAFIAIGSSLRTTNDDNQPAPPVSYARA